MRSTTICLALVVSSCAPRGQLVYVAPSNNTISTTTEEGHGSTPSHNIYVINASTEPIIVFGVALRDCENVKQQCDMQPANIRINGGDRRVVLRVEPRNLQSGYSYRFSYSWRPEKP